MKKILIIDENTIYREGLKALFQTNASSYHVDDLKNYFQCFDFLSNRSNRPDYIILCCHDDNPELLNESPFETMWLIKVTSESFGVDKEDLVDYKTYREEVE